MFSMVQFIDSMNGRALLKFQAWQSIKDHTSVDEHIKSSKQT